MISSLLSAIWYELTCWKPEPRIAEQELVMNATQTVRDYSAGGEVGKALYGPYLLNALQVSARLSAGNRILDLGCGSGRLLNIIAKWNPAVRFTGVDLAPEMLEAARMQADEMRLDNVEYLEADFSSLEEFASNSFDGVISSMALHHLPDRISLHRCFCAINRVLKPDGILYLMDMGHLRSGKAIDIFVAKVARTETQALSEDYRASLHAAFTTQDFTDEIAAMGRANVSLNKTLILPLVIVVSTPLPPGRLDPETGRAFQSALSSLSPQRSEELRYLKLFLRSGGLKFPALRSGQ